MVLQISQAYFPYLLGLYICLIGIQFMFGFWMLSLYLQGKRENKTPAPYIIAITFFFLCLAVGRVIFAWFDFVLTSFNDATYPTYAWVWKIATGISMFGLAFFAYQLETKPLQNKTHGVLTLIVIVFIVIMVIYPVVDLPSYNIDQFFEVGAIIPIAVTPFIYFYLAAQVPGYKVSGVIIGVGLIVYALGEVAIAEFVVVIIQNLGYTREFVYTAAQVFKIVGMILIGSAFVKELRRWH
ncbi:MAG TPA: hypothetical protein VKK79_09745 [Candidatus Lokiarchaeia archaeon]|nr:hypothetical protein [Candidatus Lokiarchaeia archaeon]